MKLCDQCRRIIEYRDVHYRDSALTEIDPYPVTLALCQTCAEDHDRLLNDQADDADLRREEQGEPPLYGRGA